MLDQRVGSTFLFIFFLIFVVIHSNLLVEEDGCFVLFGFSSHFCGCFVSNYEAWLSDPTHIRPSAQLGPEDRAPPLGRW